MTQAQQVLTMTQGHRMHAYIVVSLMTGARTEEVRALRWDRVHLDASPPHFEVWRSVRTGGDTKTEKSRRTLALPSLVAERLREHKKRQAKSRLKAERWEDDGLVFSTAVGTAMNANNVLRDFRAALTLVPGIEPSEWTLRELRHSFVSVLSASGVSVEQIADLVGHRGTRTTELVYRHQLKPVLQTGATVMDTLFAMPEAQASNDA